MLIAASLLLVLALVLFWWGNRQKSTSGVPSGKIVSIDLHDSQRPQQSLFSRRYLLTGRPDYLLRRGRELIPVEIKTVNEFRQPFEGHIFQLFAYCLLVEEQFGVQPRFGYLQYRSRLLHDQRTETYQIEFNDQMKSKVLELLNQMRQVEQSGEAHRSHEDVARCRGCGYAAICDQRL
jgi:CRISPR-associated exonuclease Cas4